MKTPVKIKFESIAHVVEPTSEQKRSISKAENELVAAVFPTFSEQNKNAPANPNDSEFILIKGQGYCAGKNN